MVTLKNINVLTTIVKLLSELSPKELEELQKMEEDQSLRAPQRRADDEKRAALKAKSVERQRAYRATPEGRQRTNEASKKSHALAKSRATEEAKELLAQKVSAHLSAKNNPK